VTDEISLLTRLTHVLRSARVRYFVTGSIAAMYYGEARSTRDIDVAVFLRFGDVDAICEAFPEPAYYADRLAIVAALRQCGMFNVIDNATGMKIDFMCVEPQGYDNSRFQRAREVEIVPGVLGFIAAPEDVILKKLQFFKLGASDKHLRDIASMIKISGETFDRAYLDSWAISLGVVDEWNALKSRLGW